MPCDNKSAGKIALEINGGVYHFSTTTLCAKYKTVQGETGILKLHLKKKQKTTTPCWAFCYADLFGGIWRFGESVIFQDAFEM